MSKKPIGVRGVKLLLIGTSVLFGLWIGVLVVMYLLTVYPERHPSRGAAASTIPSAGV